MPLSTKDITADQAFLQPILDHPHDDGPRLIYADWLMENADPRGEFIHVQCRLATMALDDPERPALLAREKALLTTHGAAWLEPVQRLVDEARLRRGFVEDVNVGAAKFLKHAERLRRRAPVVRLALTHLEGRLAEVLAAPPLGGITDLDLAGNHLGSRSLKLMASAPFLAQVTRLGLRRCELNAESARAFPQSLMGQLTSLDLAHNALGEEGVQVLAAAATMERLHELYLEGNNIQAAGLRALLQVATLRHLSILGLGSSSLDCAGADELARWAGRGSLRVLDLSKNIIGNAGAVTLAESGPMPNLTRLNLAHNRIGDRGMTALVSSPFLSRLVHLDLEGNEFGDLGAQGLAASPHLGNLRELNLDRNRLYDKGACALAASPVLAGLTRLRIKSSYLTKIGKQALQERFGERLRL